MPPAHAAHGDIALIVTSCAVTAATALAAADVVAIGADRVDWGSGLTALAAAGGIIAGVLVGLRATVRRVLTSMAGEHERTRVELGTAVADLAVAVNELRTHLGARLDTAETAVAGATAQLLTQRGQLDGLQATIGELSERAGATVEIVALQAAVADIGSRVGPMEAALNGLRAQAVRAYSDAMAANLHPGDSGEYRGPRAVKS